MSDWEVWAPDDATMQAAIATMGVRLGGSFAGTTQYAWDYYGTKYVQSGTKQQAGPGGAIITVPNMVAQPGVYGNLRWLGVGTVRAPQGSGITVNPLVAPFYRVFA